MRYLIFQIDTIENSKGKHGWKNCILTASVFMLHVSSKLWIDLPNKYTFLFIVWPDLICLKSSEAHNQSEPSFQPVICYHLNLLFHSTFIAIFFIYLFIFCWGGTGINLTHSKVGPAWEKVSVIMIWGIVLQGWMLFLMSNSDTHGSPSTWLFYWDTISRKVAIQGLKPQPSFTYI